MILLMFVYAAVRDSLARPWMAYQRTFYRHVDRAAPPKGWNPVQVEQKLAIRQLQLADFRDATGSARIDRCQTCHMAIDSLDPGYRDLPEPFRSHVGTFLVSHPPEVYGCTICHQGQGMATTVEAAHGYEDVRDPATGKPGHWNRSVHNIDTPILVGQNIEAACIKCHTGGAVAMVGRKAVDATPHWTAGRRLFKSVGCIGCHSLYGEGGKAAPELTEVGSKYPDQFDMRHVKGPHSVANWIFEHFKEPTGVVQADPAIGIHFPSDMPNQAQLNLSDQDVADLTTYAVSLTTDKVYAKYMKPNLDPAVEREPKSFPSRIAHGQYVYHKFGCIGCHGVPLKMEDQRHNWNAKGGVIPKLFNLSERYSRDELRDFILHGSANIAKDKEELETPPLWMPAWRERGLGGQELEDLLDWLLTLRKAVPKSEENF